MSVKPQERALGTLRTFHDFYPLTPVFLSPSRREQAVQLKHLTGKLNVPHREILAGVCFLQDLATDVFTSGL